MSRQYRSLSSLDTPALSLDDQSRGDGGVVFERDRTQPLVLCNSCIQTILWESEILSGLNTPSPGELGSKIRLWYFALN
jgi:hypothetical protein